MLLLPREQSVQENIDAILPMQMGGGTALLCEMIGDSIKRFENGSESQSN